MPAKILSLKPYSYSQTLNRKRFCNPRDQGVLVFPGQQRWQLRRLDPRQKHQNQVKIASNPVPLVQPTSQEKLITKLKEQPYFKALPNQEAQTQLISWLDGLISREENLDRVMELTDRRGQERGRITPYQWFDLLIQDQLTDADKTKVTSFHRLGEKNTTTQYSNGKFYERRFELGIRALKATNETKIDFKQTIKDDLRDKSGVDFLLGFTSAHDFTQYITVQVKSTLDAVKQFFTPRNQSKRGHKNILALDLSFFTISNLLGFIKQVGRLVNDHLSKGSISVTVPWSSNDNEQQTVKVFSFEPCSVTERKTLQEWFMTPPQKLRPRSTGVTR